MKRFFLLLFLLNTVLLTQFTHAQKKMQCGLLTNFALFPSSKLYSAAESDIKLLNALNNELKVSSYMNKAIIEGSRKIIVSLFTTGTYDDFVKQINESKHAFVSKKTIDKEGVQYSCYNFKYSDKNISRIVYNEPQLTLCVSFDIISTDPNPDYNKINNEIINRISFTKMKK